jgi:hypothetical protein
MPARGSHPTPNSTCVKPQSLFDKPTNKARSRSNQGRLKTYQSMSTVLASGYKCSKVPGSMRALAMKVSTSCSCKRITRPNLYAGNCPSSMNLYKVRSETPRRLAASLVDSQRRSDEAMSTLYPPRTATMCNSHDISLPFVTGHHYE